jgi:RluA family pseudouridine synthase
VEEWQGECEAGRIISAAGDPISADFQVRTGERVYRVQPGITEPNVNTGIDIIHEDEAIVVLNKPAPLPMHPGGRFNRNTLEYFLDAAYEPHHPRPAHRLDANTTGLVVCSRTRRYAGRLQPQFSAGTVEKVYLVRVFGSPADDVFACDAPISAEPGELGTRTVEAQGGLPAKTEFKVLNRSASDGTTLLEARPLTGRTNQIRVHLWDIGFPVVGDPAYLPNRQLGTTLTLSVDAPPLCLHAWQISFDHPKSGERVRFLAEAPAWVGEFAGANVPASPDGA